MASPNCAHRWRGQTAGGIIISRVYARKAAAERTQPDRIMTSEMIQLLESAVNKLAPASP
jgi:hypothetical protein